MKIVIFGVGRLYRDRKQEITSEYEIVAFLDNNPKLQGQSIDGASVFAPEKILQLSYNKIVLMSASEEAMKKQLIGLGVNRKDIWYWERFASEMFRGRLQFYCELENVKDCKKRVLIVSNYLDYTGGPFAAVYAAKALKNRGYEVLLTASSGEKTFIDEMTETGINIALCPSLPYVHKEELMWIQQFDVILVNVFPMVPCVGEFSKVRPVLWWIHESVELLYHGIMNRYEEYVDKEQIKKAQIYAVSKVAQSKFNFYCSDRIKKIMPYGIPDLKRKNSFSHMEDGLVFAVIGTVHVGKAQDVFVKAVGHLRAEEKERMRFLIIGSIGTDEYSSAVRELASKEPTVEITGRLTRKEIGIAYEKIDIVVCPSLEDSLPIVATEGMMYGKVCIVSDVTGTADYIEDEKNGLICKAGDPEELCRKMRWVIQNQKKLPEMGRKARQIYKKHFSMESFGERLEAAMRNTQEAWKLNKQGNI